MSEDPWQALETPRDATSVSARRIDETNRWDFYWGRDSEQSCLLLLAHNSASSPRDRLPQLKGVEVSVRPAVNAERPSLVLRLLEQSLRDIFHQLCLDIVMCAGRATSEAEAVATAVARTWRWHHLLRGGGSGILSPDEQKGLIGELLVLERYLLPALSTANAIAGWCGPLGRPQDFVVGRVGIEAKARGSATAAEVMINSEYQLDDAEFDQLFLHLSVLDATGPEREDGFTVTDVAARIKETLLNSHEHHADRYDALLGAAGFRFEDDYSNARWTGGERSIYIVEGNFPRLITGQIPAGTANVRYTLAIAECGPYLVAPAMLAAALSGEA